MQHPLYLRPRFSSDELLFIWQPQQNLLIVFSTFPPSIDDAIYVNSSKFSMPLVMSQSNRFLSEIQWHDFLLMSRGSLVSTRLNRQLGFVELNQTEYEKRKLYDN